VCSSFSTECCLGILERCNSADGWWEECLVARTLITTADERTWPKDKSEPVLFLGEWCKRFSRKHIWEKMDYIVADYHWDDRKKLFNDYQYLQELHEELLVDLSDKLNQLHDKNHSLRYWRILVGIWLGYFVQMLFDRWFMLQKVIGEHEISKCFVIDRDVVNTVPNDMSDFVDSFVNDDWNEAICTHLLGLCWSINIALIPVNAGEEVLIKNHIIAKKSTNVFLYKKGKDYINNIIQLYNKLTTKRNSYFFISTYLPVKTEFKLQIMLGQLPRLYRSHIPPKVKHDKSNRCWSLISSKDDDLHEFDRIVRSIVSLQIPTVFLEGYKVLETIAQKLPWPVSPKMIFTSNSYASDELFKIWAAEKTEQGVALVIGQHGGHYGTSTFAHDEAHQIMIADCWLSWGWENKIKKNVIPIGNLKEFGRSDVRYDVNGGALMVEMILPRYSYRMYAMPVARQWMDYLEDQFSFLSSLPKYLQKKVKLRLFPEDYGWDQLDRWNENMPEINIETSVGSIRNLMKQNRIYISTYNATTYLESLSWNVPTIIFWNETLFELNDETKLYFDLLKSVGIFHDTPQGAAQHMIKVWDDVDEWWKSDEVQAVREKFCHQYARNPNNHINKLKSIFQDLAK
jgi:putative transferase (TIGR04331 family)